MLTEYGISVLPNNGNSVRIKYKISGEKAEYLRCTQFCSILGGRCSRMPSKIIKITQRLLNEKRIEQIEVHAKEELNQRMSNIESNLGRISNQKEELNQRISNIESNLSNISDQLNMLLTAKNI